MWAIRNSDIDKLRLLCEAGQSMSACNRYSESVLHMACRRSEHDVVDFLLCNGANAETVDDYGRTPLHDACWRTVPCFDIVALLLNRNANLLRCTDIRGAIPLHYVKEEDWALWCNFLYEHREKYWGIGAEAQVGK